MPSPLAAIAASAAVLLSGWPAASPAQQPGSIERGRALLAQYQCGSCHTIPGVAAARGDKAAPLTQWRKRSYIAGRLPNRPQVLVQWIAAPQSLVPGTAMPSMGVSPDDAQAMAAYLFSLE
jgi:mono/diheme cytochrome c family protein